MSTNNELDSFIGELAETQAWIHGRRIRPTQAITFTFVIESDTREEALAQFVEHFQEDQQWFKDRYGIVAAAVELVPTEDLS